MTRFGSICTGYGHFGEFRHAHEGGLHGFRIQVDIVRDVALGAFQRFQHQGHGTRTVTNLDHVARLAAEGRNVGLDAVHLDVAVVDELTGREDGRHELGAVDDRVQTAFQQADQVSRRVTLAARSLVIGAAELLLGDVAVVALELLLGHQLQAEIRHLALAALAVLARTVGTRVDRRLRTAPQVFTHAAVNLVFLRMTLRHVLSIRCGPARPPSKACDLNGGSRIVPLE